MSAPVHTRRHQEIQGEKARKEIVDAIVFLTRRDGRPPTIREMGLHVGRPSTGNVSYHLDRLVRWGVVVNMGGTRGYKVVRQ